MGSPAPDRECLPVKGSGISRHLRRYVPARWLERLLAARGQARDQFLDRDLYGGELGDLVSCAESCRLRNGLFRFRLGRIRSGQALSDATGSLL